MGQDLEYRCGSKTIEWRISRNDWQLHESLREHLPAEIETLFQVQELGEPVKVSVDQVRRSAEQVQAFLSTHPKALPRSFQFKPGKIPLPRIADRGSGEDVPEETQSLLFIDWGAGGMGGLRLPNDPDHWYTIRAGLNECQLEQLAVGPDGKGVFKGSRDIRNEKSFETTNMGTFLIRSRAAKSEIRPMLRDILAFVENAEQPEIIKTIC